VSLLAVGDEPLSEGFVIVSPSTARDEQQVNVNVSSSDETAVDDVKTPVETVADDSLVEILSLSDDDRVVEQWRRSIVVSDVPQEILSSVLLKLEIKKRGGGSIDSHCYDPENRKVLVAFHDAAGKS